jgi:type I restriction enzyme, S subunit
MNATELLAVYERVADSPDAVLKLRRFILELAVRGKLAPFGAADYSMPHMMQSSVTSKSIGFAIPSLWVAARLGQVATCLDYMRRPINAAEREKRTADKAPADLVPYYGATQQQGWIDDYIFDEELLLLGEDGIPFFDPFRAKAYLVSGRTWVNNHAHVFRCTMVLPRFLVHYLNVFDYTGRVAGATRAKLNQAAALDIPIPVPPMAEQHRIVAKVDELMALCDQLEAARTERETARDRLAATSLARLNVPDPDKFQSDARFALNVLPALSARPDQVKQLRQTILNLAVRGKLVPQNPREERASELLRRILVEKRGLITGGRIRKSEVEESSDEASTPFARPAGWVWSRLGESSNCSQGSTYSPTSTLTAGVLASPTLPDRQTSLPTDFELRGQHFVVRQSRSAGNCC